MRTIFTLISHEWKAFLRSSFWQQSIVQNIFLGLFGLYLAAMAIFIGFGAGKIIELSFPNSDVVKVFTGIFCLYLIIDLIVRFMLQKYPSISLLRYITQNISKRYLTHYLLGKSLISFFNLLPLLIVIPFFFLHVIPNYAPLKSLNWLCFIGLGILINNYLSYYLDRLFGKRPTIAILLLGIIILLVYLNYKGYISIYSHLLNLYDSFLMTWIGCAVQLVALLSIYYVLFRYIRTNAYIDMGSVNQQRNTYDFSFFNRFGRLGHWMQLEAKLIWRNKRPRQFLYVGIFIFFYPILLFDSLDSTIILLMMSFVVTGAFAINYSTLLLSWNSNHFDLILTQNLSIKEYLTSKYLLMALICLFFTLIGMLYGFVNSKFIPLNISMLLFNLGITIPAYIFLSIYTSKKIDLGKGTMMNYEGFGVAHYLMMIPLLVVPMGIYLLCDWLKSPVSGIVFIGILGLIGVLCHQKILATALERFNQRKYELQSNLSK